MDYMEKRKLVIVSLVALFCLLVLGLSLLIFRHNQHRIHLSDVDRIQFGNSNSSQEWSDEDTEQFVNLFNAARYAGKGIGDGGTPELQIFVYFQDGSCLIVSEFAAIDRDFEVSLRNQDGIQVEWYYVNSEALEVFLLELWNA